MEYTPGGTLLDLRSGPGPSPLSLETAHAEEKEKQRLYVGTELLKGRIENEWAWFIINNGIPFCNLFYNYRS